VLPWTKNIDLRFNKGFRIGTMDITAYADMRNVLNFRNIVGAYAETAMWSTPSTRTTCCPRVRRHGFGSQQRRRDGERQRDGHQSEPALLQLGQARQLRVAAARGSPVRERRRTYTLAEQTTALNAFYRAFFGPEQFNGQPRHIRLGFELNF